jgi:non-canonical poly(A) RNA polymerase PAPD5/7
MDGIPEERLHESNGVAKFRDLDELSDDDQLDMEISSQSDEEQPAKKRTKTTDVADDSADAAPKWSNPDPYTALPCPDEAQQKKRDVVALIRKARVEDSATKAANTEAANFISFDSSSDDDDEQDDESVPEPPREPPPPLPPLPQGPPPATNVPIPSGPAIPTGPATMVRDLDGPLGSRKRTANDEIKPPNYGQLKKATTKPAKGSVVAAWLCKPNEDGCPWVLFDHSGTRNMAFR